MINIQDGTITLCDSKFRISKNITQQELKEGIPALITSSYDTNTEYTHYGVWLDIESEIYVYATICFHGNVLKDMRLYPQHKSSVCPASAPYPMHLEEAQDSVDKWYHNLFDKDRIISEWGFISYCEGDDPLYYPPCVLIRYLIQNEE